MKTKLCLLLMILFVSGCAVVKTPTISGVDQDNGQIKMSYNYGLFERPDVKWNETLDSASAQCKNWGYIDAQQSTSPQTRCTKEDQRGNCISWQVDSLYKCNLSAEQQAALNAKREKEYIKQQEDNKRIEAARKEHLDKMSTFKVIFSCDYTHRPEESGRKKVNAQELLTRFRNGDSQGYANLMTIFHCTPRNDVLQKQKHLVLDRRQLSDFNEKSAYYTIDFNLMNDAQESIWGVVAY
jgi:hypothetical protein